MNKKPLPTIGVDKYTFFKVNEDSVSGTEYGEAYNLKGRYCRNCTDRRRRQ